MGYVRVYSAPTPFEAHFVRSLLEQRGADVQVRNDNFSPYGTILAEVWVEESNLPIAEEVLTQLTATRDADGALSITGLDDAAGRVSVGEDTGGALSLCSGCGEDNPPNFELCWQCGVRLR